LQHDRVMMFMLQYEEVSQLSPYHEVNI
jgi:hypothetical protein